MGTTISGRGGKTPLGNSASVKEFPSWRKPLDDLVHPKVARTYDFRYLRAGCGKCSYRRMPWDIALIFLVLGVVLPWRGRSRMKKLMAMPEVAAMERLVLYASTIGFQWLAVAVVAWRAWAHGYNAEQLGLTMHEKAKILMASLLGAVAIAILQWLNLRRMGRLPAGARGPLQAIAARILPQSNIELLAFLALAATAGLCEEFLYRGFAMAVLTVLGSPAWMVVLISSILFGLAHLYQGRGGFFSTLVIGTVFGMARIAYDSLVPVMFWHGALDLIAGVAGPRYLVEANVSITK
jgi:CAAX protease family protein